MFIGLSTFSFTLKHCSKLPFSPENRATVRRQLRLWRLYSTACHVFMHAGFIRHLPRHSSLCVSAIIHAKDFIFAPIIRINGHIHYSHVVVSAQRSYQGYKAKHGLPSMYQTQTKMKLNDFIFYPFVKKTFLFCLQNITKKKKKITQPTHLLPLVFVTVILS